MKSVLTVTERKTLKRLEGIIEKGLPTFLEVGKALLRIREEKLYRADFKTFEDYCDQRWGMTIRHAERLMIASKTVDQMRPIGRVPTSESQVRPLMRLKRSKEQKEAWKKATEKAPRGRPTAKHVEEAVKEVMGVSLFGPGRKNEKFEKSFEEGKSFKYGPNLKTQISDYVSDLVEKYGEHIIAINLSVMLKVRKEVLPSNK